MRKKVDVCVIALTSPVLVGIYEEETLLQTIKSSEKSSDVLPEIFKEILEQYDIERIFYANGPGSFMAIKVAYIFLKSLSVLKNIPLYGTDAFYFNDNMPIKAIGKLYFVKIASEIKTEKFQEHVEAVFRLPQTLEVVSFSKNATPLYSIGAVG
jgi:tRNA A37 threonylcarbamoyladenosine modification protein TsaB